MAGGNEQKGNNLSQIIVPARDCRPWNWDSQDEVIEVIPVTDRWLASNSRKYEQVDRILEGRLTDMQNLLLSDQPNAVRRTYGPETEFSLPQARLLAYVELVGKNRQEQDVHYKKIDSLRADYTSKAEEIGKKAESKNLASRDKSKLYKSRYKPEIDGYAEKLGEERRIQELIMRKALLEIYSPKKDGGLTIDILPRIVEELKQGLNGLADDRRSEIESRIDRFLDSLTGYLQDTHDRELFIRYKYRISPGIVTSHEDTQVLASGLQMALDPEILTINTKLAGQLQNLGRAFFVFLGNRAALLSPGLGETYPRLSLIYDTLASDFASKKTSVLRITEEEVITGLYPNYYNSEGWSDEIAKVSSGFARGYHNVTHSPGLQRSKSYAQPPDAMINFALSPEYRLIMGFNELVANYPVLVKLQIINQNNRLLKTFQNINHQLEKTDPNGGFKVHEYEIEFQGIKMHTLGTKSFERMGVTADLQSLIRFHKLAYLGTQVAPPEEKITARWPEINLYLNYMRNYKDVDIALLQEALYLDSFWGKDRSRIKSVEKQNEWLKSQVSDYSRWFVSPRGDRFGKRIDPEITERGIRSLTFIIDRNHPREHQVSVEWDGEVKPTNFWLDKNCNLLDGERKPLTMESVYYQLFSNLLLRHLYVITSAKLQKESDKKMFGESELEKMIFWKRAHYRTYPVGSIYTLESEAAKDHARLIKQDYGIDIWDEIKRRREVGSLLQNQVLTFVRETQPDQAGYNAKPNELPFDPAWIPQRI